MLDKCIVVDDHEMIRETIGIMAKSIGFKECIVATNGAEAISKIYQHNPSLIITDLQMEPIDGLEMLRLIRSGRYGLPNDIPIIILTANSDQNIIAQCIDFDVDAFLVKPVNRSSLENRISQIMTQSKPKKETAYYFQKYEEEPAKTNEFQLNGTVAFTDEDMKEFEMLVDAQYDTELMAEEQETIDLDKSSGDPQDKNELSEEKQEEKEQETKRKKSKHFIKWQERFSVLNSELDESNKVLLHLINDTYDLVLEHQEGGDVFEPLAERFQGYVRDHFQLEEGILEAMNYVNIKKHKEMHDRLMKKADFILLKCQSEPELYASEFFKLLRYWWVKHVVQEDNKYRYLFE